MRVLIVEDDESLADMLCQHLISQHYAVDVAADGEAGWSYIQSVTYDLILLDIDLPLLNGIALCKRLRRHHHREPVLLLTARSEAANKVQGLDAGADDYLVKPYSTDELLARMRALLRRQDNGSGAPLLTWGPLCVDPKLCELTVNNQAIALSPKEYQLIELLLRHPQQVLSSDQILDHIWGFDDIPGKDTVRTHIRRLRKKLKHVGAENWVETVYGLGYRLKAIADGHSQKPKGDTPSPLDKSQATPISSSSSPANDVTTVPRSDGNDIKPMNTPQCSIEIPAPVSPADVARQTSMALWSKFQPKAMKHFTILETAIAALEQTLVERLPDRLPDQRVDSVDHDSSHSSSALFPCCPDEASRRQGERAAHKLVGTLGMFGKPEGSVMARQIESLLQQLQAPSALQPEIVLSVMLQLTHKIKLLKPLLVTKKIVSENTACNAGIDQETELLSYDQACRDLSKYFCLARRHRHAIALAWVSLSPDNSLEQGTHKTKLSRPPARKEAPELFNQLNPLLMNWATSIQHYFRAEDIVAQSVNNRVLFVFYACTKQDALTRLNPLIKRLLEQIQTKNKRNSLSDLGMAKVPYDSLNQPAISLSLNMAEFPKDGETLNDLEAIALASNAYVETSPRQEAQSPI